MGQALEDAAIRILLTWPEAHPGETVTWKALSAELRVSRQAIARKPAVAAFYLKVRKEKGKRFDPTNPWHIQRRAKESLIESLL